MSGLQKQQFGTQNPQSLQVTIGPSFTQLTLEVDKREYRRIKLVDTAGQEKYMSLAPQVIRQCEAVILVFDVTNTQSYEEVSTWMKLVKDTCSDDTILYLCANKIDLQDHVKVDPSMVHALKTELDLDGVYSTSAVTGQNVLELLKSIVNLLDKRKYSQLLNDKS